MKQLLQDPHLFSYIIILLYLCNAGRLALDQRWPEVAYWLSALAITVSVVYMNKS